MPKGESKNSKSNLIPLNERSKEEQDEIRRKAAAARKAKHDAKKAFKELLSEEGMELVQNSKTGEYISKRQLIAKKVVEQAMGGNPKAVKMWALLAGEMVNSVEVTGKDGKDIIPTDVGQLMVELNELRDKTEGISAND